MKYFDAFAGYGGFSLGIKQAYEDLQDLSDSTEHEHETANTDNLQGGVESNTKAGLGNPVCVGFSEIDKYAIQVYEKHFNHKNYGDITKLDPTTIPDFDLFCGGFPCQAFSIAGKRAGFEDTRGTLIYDVFRILKEKQPKFVLLENVKGLLSHDKGRTFKTIITSLAELGYAVEWQVLNAKNFGVPQNRERVFIIGHLGGFGGRQVFPIAQNDSEDIILPTITTRITADSNGTYVREKSPQIKQLIGGSQGNRVYDPSGIAVTQASQAGGLGAKTGLYVIDTDKEREYNETSNGSEEEKLGKQETEQTRSFRIRRLTPLEAERLMGLPDGWTEGVSDTQRYKLCGNGVVVNVVEEIIKKLL